MCVCVMGTFKSDLVLSDQHNVQRFLTFCNTHNFPCSVCDSVCVIMVTRLEADCYGLLPYLLLMINARLETQ